MVFLEQVEKCS